MNLQAQALLNRVALLDPANQTDAGAIAGTEQVGVKQSGLFRRLTLATIATWIFGRDTMLKTWALAQSFRLVSATRNGDGAITTATIEWPDGTAGVYTADTLSTSFPGATDAWHATYAGTPSKTITQPAVTRDGSGNVTAQPAITIV
jgi:hypothetical protein